MFRIVELTEIIRQKEDTSFIDILSQIRVGQIDDCSEIIVKPRFINIKKISVYIYY